MALSTACFGRGCVGRAFRRLRRVFRTGVSVSRPVYRRSVGSKTGMRTIYENEQLKLELEKVKEQLDKKNWGKVGAADLKARRMEIKRTIVKAQELDLCFLLDATGSMQNCIDMVKDKVVAMAGGINAQFPECKLRVAFVLYRDYDDHDTDPHTGCSFTTDFRGPESKFIKALSVVRAVGGGDAPEDVFTGLERTANLDWLARNRVVVHICDAPCHGTQFNDFKKDSYSNGDKLGRSIDNLLHKLRDHCQVKLYYFCHLNDNTKKMVQEFKKVVEDGWLADDYFRDVKDIPENVVAMSRSTICRSMSNIYSGAANFVQVSVVPTKTWPKSWESIDIVNGQQYKHKWYPSLDELLEKIEKRELLEVEKMGSLQVKIQPHPFSADGTLRWPYHAAIVQPNQAAKPMVVKRFKMPFGQSAKRVHFEVEYLSQMEVQTVAAHMAQEFNRIIRSQGLVGVKNVEFTLVSTFHVGSKIYNMEQYLDGDWIRYSNNAGYVNIGEYAATLQAFTHWTHERSNHTLIVTDLQGVKQLTDNGEKYMFLLCDPAIHCVDVLRFTRTNLGEEGFTAFFNSHDCNDICRHLGLRAPNGEYIKNGTRAYGD